MYSVIYGDLFVNNVWKKISAVSKRDGVFCILITMPFTYDDKLFAKTRKA